ncbi:troponin I [Eurytemora carolleeae]|uniref:troponin I n=1 Tax=Eurytemora carolleeae TaxID=1294199 RepID=UPI000C791683|nr:troponin I [Eurytemora carolleeae]|eukprot:XP_023329572.1 troponin I-like [Eurytemora affinis]
MAIPDAVKSKVGDMPNVGEMDKDALAALIKQLYDQSCSVFAEKFNMEHEIKKNEMEIHALELEVNDMHGKFIIPQLKKVNNFKLMGGEEA